MKRGVLTITSLLAVALTATLIVVRSRDSSSVAPKSATLKTSETNLEGPEAVEAASPTSSNVASAKDGEAQAASAPSSDDVQRVNRAPTARFRGRMVYESSREPVPWCIVAVRAPGQAGELRIADEQGHFATAFEYAATKLDVLAWDQPDPPYDWTGAQSVEHIPTNPTEVEVAVRVWPTIIVDGGMPDGRDPRRWKFQLGLGSEFSEARVMRSGVLLWRNHPQAFGFEAGSLEMVYRSGPPWWLVIDDEKQGLCCSMQLDHIDGVLHVSPLWQKRGSLLVALRTEAAARPDYRVYARLRPALTAFDDAAHGRNLKSGWIHLEKLRPGDFVLDVTSQFCATAHVPVTIHPDEMTKVEVLLACEPATESIRGVVRSESGTRDESTARFVQLRSTENGVVLANGTIQWTKESGSSIGRFELGPLPAREYELSIDALSAIATRPATPLNVKPGDELDITLLDRAPRIDVGFEVFDKETGAAIEEFTVGTDAGTGNWNENWTKSRDFLIEDLPQGARIAWAVSAQGYQRVSGTLESASRSWRVDGRRRWVQVELERGTVVSVIVHANDGSWEDFSPIVGASVLLDGHEVGRTDNRGSFRLKLPEHFESIDVSYLNWRHAANSRTRTIRGQLVWFGGQLEFTLEPP